MKIAGLVLAAGAGRRMGTPKALVRDADGVTWVVRTSRLLTEAGCSPVVVVVGASADQVRGELSDEPVEVVEATDWDEGMGASLRAGLRSTDTLSDAVLVATVDVPGLTAAAVRRVANRVGEDALVRATYRGVPGHPVLIGRAHWDGVIASARGDEGARGYLREHEVVLVECGDVGDGEDVDTVGELPPGHG
ncbi:NTP transferase domain-containing protein [Kribbella sp. VKM Ac-2566]|uniref:nucleotidyltransferase family protein n=1 Tax=Kribbella sp. VKM Ac-2566 TaxID=2512218 RepID=UPI0010EB7BEB|nr:nucleotidyltransferase family protein [Kribbella sp. VKM Ac-2566]TDX02819.1 nicotine blue oxidoreductase [Kribbella sp. VKM Ac-2566]